MIGASYSFGGVNSTSRVRSNQIEQSAVSNGVIDEVSDRVSKQLFGNKTGFTKSDLRNNVGTVPAFARGDIVSVKPLTKKTLLVSITKTGLDTGFDINKITGDIDGVVGIDEALGGFISATSSHYA